MALPPLPPALLRGARPRRRWLAAGVGDGELSGPLWLRLSHGMYAWNGGGEHLLPHLHHVGSLASPGGAVGGWAAARLHGARDLDGRSAAGQVMPILLCLPRRETCRRAGPGVRVWRSDLGPEDVVRVEGTPVTSPVRTGFDLARLCPFTPRAGRGELEAAEALVLVEALLRTGTTSVDEIAAHALAHPRKAGAGQARRVLDRAVAGTRSCQETRFRLLWTADAGLPEPLVNARLADRAGRFAAEVDLLDPDAALAGEYDGAHHAGARQRADDHARIQRLEALGLVVARVAAPDLTEHRRRTVRRLRALRARGLARDRGLDTWHVLSSSAPGPRH